ANPALLFRPQGSLPRLKGGTAFPRTATFAANSHLCFIAGDGEPLSPDRGAHYEVLFGRIGHWNWSGNSLRADERGGNPQQSLTTCQRPRGSSPGRGWPGP